MQDVKDDEEELEGNFFNDLYTVVIENEKATWSEGEIRFDYPSSHLLNISVLEVVRFPYKQELRNVIPNSGIRIEPT